MGNGVQNKILIFITFITATTVFSDEYNVKKTWFGDPDLASAAAKTAAAAEAPPF